MKAPVVHPLRIAIHLAICFLALIFALGFLIGRASAQSGRHGDGHAEMHDRYRHWSPPGNPGTSCCNDADCRPTRAFVDTEGNWRAWNGSAWLIVPQERMLPADYAGDGRCHLCAREDTVYCFSPCDPKS